MPTLRLALLLASWACANLAVSCKSVQQVEDADAQIWNEETARVEVKDDVTLVVEKFDQHRPKLLDIIKDFKKDLNKDDGIRKLAMWAITFGNLLDLHAGTREDEALYDRLIDSALLLLSVRKTEYSFVERQVLRGWPMRLSPKDVYAVYEGFNFGYIGQSIALAARAAALRGDHELANRLVVPVLAALYDGFLTSDPEKTKLDDQGRLVHVPASASDDRHKRYKEVGGDPECLDTPEAYNHGVQVARAAIALLRAIEVIDWNAVKFEMKEWNLDECRWRLNEFVLQNAEWFRSALIEAPPTGADSELDKYPGPDGTPWFMWKYRDLSTCEIYQGTHMDRYQDIVHAKHELDFVADFRAAVAEGVLRPPRCSSGRRALQGIFSPDIIHGLLVTFLNRIVFDYDAAAKGRFACDVAGIHDSTDHPYEWKSCKGSRKKLVRPKAAAGWLALALTAKMDLAQPDADPLMRCDAYRMVDTVLPLALKGNNKFAGDSFAGVDGSWVSGIIEAKFHFYNWRQAVINACSQFISPPPPSPPPPLPPPYPEYWSPAATDNP